MTDVFESNADIPKKLGRRQRSAVLLDIFAVYGNASRLAAQLKITRAAVSSWDRVPLKHLKTISQTTGIERKRIRPDLYDDPET